MKKRTSVLAYIGIGCAMAIGLLLLVWTGLGLVAMRMLNQAGVVVGVAPFRILRGYKDYGISVTFSPDGKLLATLDMGSQVKLWDTATWQPVRSVIIPGKAQCLAFSPDSKMLAIGTADDSAQIWRVADLKPIRRLQGSDLFVEGIAYSPDGRTIVGGGIESDTVVWDAATGIRLHTLPADRDTTCVAFSPDGQTLARGNLSGFVDLWDTASWKKTMRLDTRKEIVGRMINTIAFSADGRQIAAGDTEAAVTLWDVQTGELAPAVAGHDYSVHSVVFFRDGRTLASAGDYTVRLWDTTTGASIQTLRDNPEVLYGIAISPDQKTIAATGTGKVIDLWHTPNR